MRISHKYQFVFLSNPRTGSTSIRKILDKYADIKSILITDTSDDFPFYHHIPATELKRIFDQNGWKWDNYHRFCIVRNPFTRVVSLYQHYKKMYYGKYYYQLNTIDKITNLLKKKSNSCLSFKEYVQSINPKSKLTTTLTNFISDDEGNFLVDNILRFEKLQEELPKHLKSIGITIKPEEIPRLNTSETTSYKKFYDNETKQKVSEIYRYEIERFNYEFDSIR